MQTLPKTIYLWLVLLVASMLLGPRLAPRPPKSATPTRYRLSGAAFEGSLEAERLLITHYGLKLVNEGMLWQAHELYRQFALKEADPTLGRKALILASQLTVPPVPLDEALLKRLPEKERPLWRALYSPTQTPLPTDAEAQLKAMHLGFLTHQVLADLYQTQGNTSTAAAARTRRDTQAHNALWRMISLVLAGILLGMIGLGLLLFAVFVAARREWHLLGRVPESESAQLGWGDLLDGFVFYLAIYRAGALLVRLVISGLSLHPAQVLLQVALQAGMGALAVYYVVVQAKKRGACLSELGWTRTRLGTNIAYGIAGYAMTLPLTIALGALSKVLFRNNPNTEPNALLPLLTGSTTLWERGLLFASASIFAPLFEELFFRGALFTGLRRRFSGIPSILLSAVIFASVHPMQDWLSILGLGVSFGIMRHLRQSVVPGMVAHFLQNTATFLLLIALFGE
ncbi:CPBP family intramembrane glutamic endopeptidase [Armatimonas sp.]|uniref:CPBP family intramembrane glutamic endopeptidase n=1 Tax=Armatimonas sp. TaxID=1872638 RepID=UPI0037525387